MLMQMNSIELMVPDMMCGSCAKKITAAIRDFDAGAQVTANPETKQVIIVSEQSADALRSAIEDVGFEVLPV